MQKALLIIGTCLLLFLAGCGDDSSTTAGTSPSETTEEQPTNAEESPSPAEEDDGEAAKKTKPKVSAPQGAPPSELVVNDIEEGTGPAAKAGDEVTVHYVGVQYKDGKQFDASWDRGEPFAFPLGTEIVIPGWEQGVEGMKAGGRRELVIPPDLAYGPQGVGEIRPNETLVFVVDLLKVD